MKHDTESARLQLDLGLEAAPNHAGLLRYRAAISRLDPDRFDDALADYRRAVALDPLSAQAASAMGFHLVLMRRLDEAREVLDRAIDLDPLNMGAIRSMTLVYAARGDLDGARRFLRAAAGYVEESELIGNLAVFEDLFWVIDDSWQELLLELDAEPFGGAEADRHLAFAHTCHLRGEISEAGEHAEEARDAYREMLDVLPNDSQINSLLGVSLAYLGQRDDAIAKGRRGVELWEADRDQPHPYCPLQLVRIHVLLGEHDRAIELLEPLLEVPFYLTPAWLGIDPLFDPLRDHPRFKALLEKYDTN